jgi:tRNA dimethylallyltransferase
VIAVVGPTASGKSDLGVALALELGGEVVNADSMQLYRGMDVGTAKLTQDERQGVPHHLLDVWEVTEAASVVDYQARARAVVDRLRGEGRTPVLVGGSGLYVRAVLDPRVPGHRPRGRASRLEDMGSGACAPRTLDPAAATPSPSNGRRRGPWGLEITGGPLPAFPTRDYYPSVQVARHAAPGSTAASTGGSSACGRPGSSTSAPSPRGRAREGRTASRASASPR